ncbi:group I truncated hemoglobin [Cryptosporangium minutisporangium]|uniref:Group 1 truncated hemoglobin n=1 Tax=Cryptosporangium minutisporangium TaxID=113569 RepID=A0ABP6T159_9ACTN
MGTEAAPDTNFDRIGGAPAVAAVVDVFYEEVLADPLLAPYFEGVDLERLKEHQRLFVGQALGAGPPYTGRAMNVAHAGLGITPAAFAAVIGHLGAALADAGADDEMIYQAVDALAPLAPEIITA